MFVKIFGGVIAEASAEDGPVAVAACIGTASAGVAGCVGGGGVIEDRQLIGIWIVPEFVIGGKWEGVEVD